MTSHKFFLDIIDADQRQYDGIVREVERRNKARAEQSTIIICD